VVVFVFCASGIIGGLCFNRKRKRKLKEKEKEDFRQIQILNSKNIIENNIRYVQNISPNVEFAQNIIPVINNVQVRHAFNFQESIRRGILVNYDNISTSDTIIGVSSGPCHECRTCESNNPEPYASIDDILAEVDYS
jgi:hypothetical protein